MKNDHRTGKARRIAAAREGTRNSLRAGQYIRRLREIANQCDTVEPERVPALRLKADIYRNLLSKVLPDLKAIEHSGGFEHRHVTDLSDAELADIAAGRSAGVAETPGGPTIN